MEGRKSDEEKTENEIKHYSEKDTSQDWRWQQKIMVI